MVKLVQIGGQQGFWVRMRLRSILRRRRKGRDRGRGRDHQRWLNAFFAQMGLFSLEQAHRQACQFMKMAHWLESRMREIRPAGLAGGEAGSTGLSCPDTQNLSFLS
ncbi:MAG: hypothetical protein IT440_12305 [Phycisphaeraceae bacterium]|nr:hypothetical protein [Phycisphaeraceae bacterium]